MEWQQLSATSIHLMRLAAELGVLFQIITRRSRHRQFFTVTFFSYHFLSESRKIYNFSNYGVSRLIAPVTVNNSGLLNFRNKHAIIMFVTIGFYRTVRYSI